jgi:hypothetical protein
MSHTGDRLLKLLQLREEVASSPAREKRYDYLLL